MAIGPGSRLGPYEVLSALGAGGMGEIYKATDTRLNRTVAIKVLPEHVATGPELKPRFEREAKTLASLSHPHIGAPVVLFPTRIVGGGSDNNQGRQYDATRDGRFLVNTVSNDAAEPITLLQNWKPPETK